jgi:hypothetical protein
MINPRQSTLYLKQKLTIKPVTASDASKPLYSGLYLDEDVNNL